MPQGPNFIGAMWRAQAQHQISCLNCLVTYGPETQRAGTRLSVSFLSRVSISVQPTSVSSKSSR